MEEPLEEPLERDLGSDPYGGSDGLPDNDLGGDDWGGEDFGGDGGRESSGSQEGSSCIGELLEASLGQNESCLFDQAAVIK